MNKTRSFIGSLILGTVITYPAQAINDSSTSATPRFSSPSGHYELVFEPLSKDWTHLQKAQPGIVGETMEQYAITLYPARSAVPVNVIYYADSGDLRSPDDIAHAMLWSPHEKYVVVSDKLKSREGNHIFQLVASLERRKVWRLEADHVRWVDDGRLLGELNTKEVPGGIVVFDGNVGKGEMLIQPDSGVGYQIAGLSDHQATVKQFLNNQGTGKTTWDLFIPSCFDLNLDTLKKRSISCPKEAEGAPAVSPSGTAPLTGGS